MCMPRRTSFTRTHVHTTALIRMGTVRSRARRFFARTVIFWHVSIRPRQPCRNNVSKCAAQSSSASRISTRRVRNRNPLFTKENHACRHQLRNAGRGPVFPLRATPRRRPFSGADAMRRRTSRYRRERTRDPRILLARFGA